MGPTIEAALKKHYADVRGRLNPPPRLSPSPEPTPEPKVCSKALAQKLETNRAKIGLLSANIRWLFCIPEGDWFTGWRSHQIRFPQWIALHITKRVTKWDNCKIGRHYGMDPSSVRHALGRMRKIVQSDPLMWQIVEYLIADFEEEADVE